MIAGRLEVLFVKKLVIGEMIYYSSLCAIGMIDKRTLQISQIDRWSARKKLVFVLNVDSFGAKHRQITNTFNKGNISTVGKYSIVTNVETLDRVKEFILTYFDNLSFGVRKRDYSSALCLSMIHRVD
jgi:hypothetical protein